MVIQHSSIHDLNQKQLLFYHTNFYSFFIQKENILIIFHYFISRFRLSSCSRCGIKLNKNDLIFQVNYDTLYHESCFTCYSCGRLLKYGDTYILENQTIQCSLHNHTTTNNNSNPGPIKNERIISNEKLHKRLDKNNGKIKRIRTSFKHQQLRIMKSYFEFSHNPDSKDLKQLSQKTGLSKRVLQVS
ncbi:unnamed protein product [Schistosoma margrebowiei]|uniref:Uncharacterized protein n=1 Tax=Schistosoma margrebowiei TaxID=48269 RepID=A0A183LS74_9TREM|nr:unnamed protein product [Schistosoma margrebowiei]